MAIAANPEPASNAASAPRIWLLVGDKLGDNAQLEVIADALGLPVERKELRFLKPYQLGKPRFEASLHHLDPARSAALAPPWPDLVLTVGRRPAMAALWVRNQSGGRSKIVLVGRPRRRLEDFDLVIAPPQYRLPDHPSILPIGLPLMRSDEAAVAAASAAWRSRLEALPRPLTAVLVGGPTQPFRFDAGVARRLLETARRVTEADGGTLFLTTSRRTPAEVADALDAGLPEGARLYRWVPEADENPYQALIGLADRFVVTGDSISMLTEVARRGRPLAVFELPRRHGSFGPLRRGLVRLLLGDAEAAALPVLRPLGRMLFGLGLIGHARDLTALHRALYARGLAVPLGTPFRPAAPAAEDDLPRVTARIRELLGAS